MDRRSIMTVAAAAALALGLLPHSTMAQQKSLKDQIIGTWTVVSWEQTLKDGSKLERFGNSPKGVNTFTRDGHFTLILMRPDLPKISSNNPMKPTPAEAEAITVGSIAYFGTYTVDEGTKTITEQLDGTTLANQLAIPQKREVTSISATEMKYRNAQSVAGGNIELVFKRAQ